jgi:endoglycosylceramidase
VRGTSIVNPMGGKVILRGVNYEGYELEYPLIETHSETAYRIFAQLGFNVVRLPIAWGNLEPSPGAFQEQYLTNYVDQDVRWAKKYGIYIVLDMHQLYWGKRWGGYGIPDWVTAGYPATDEGMRQAVTNFWTQDALQSHLIDVWKRVADRYSNETTIAGYDILNEPWVYTSIQNLNASYVDDFYMKAIKAIRVADPSHIIILEPANMISSQFPIKQNIVWSPHFYTLSFAESYQESDARLLDADLAAKYQKFVVEFGSPMWIGEFGAFMKDGTQDSWVRDALNAFDKYGVGWAWWAFNGTVGVPLPLYTKPQEQTATEIHISIIDVEVAILLASIMALGVSVAVWARRELRTVRSARGRQKNSSEGFPMNVFCG